MRADYPKAELVDSLRSLWKEAFADSDAFLDSFFDTAFAPDRSRCIAIDGQAAAALYWFDCSCRGTAMAYIYAVATRKKQRGQGLCRALMEDTHRLLKSLGYAGCILVPGQPALRDMYEKLGYADFSGMDTVTCKADGTAQLRQLTAEEYQTRRGSCLPEGGVQQQSIDFLAAYASFYAGEDFLLAATENGDALTGLELLGNAAAAPAILGALGKEDGSFRVPGAAPFAMYHPLSDAPAPGYFGLAFD